MKTSTRLLLPLLAAVVLVMGAYAVWAIRQRESTLTQHSRRETHAYAAALGVAIEAAFRSPAPDEIQEIIDRISEEPSVSGVYVYGDAGALLYVSNPLTPSGAAQPDVIARVLATGQPSTVDRLIDDISVYSVVRPVHDGSGTVIGAFEVAQPLSFLEDQIAQTRQRFLLNTVTLLLAVTVVILWLVRARIAQPLQNVVAGAQAIGRGELEHRIEPGKSGAELVELASEFNRMATRLETAHADLVREADERVQLERRLRESEKFAAIGNLAAALAHEIGAPLHVIRGRAELLLRHGSSEAERKNLRIIIEQISRITVIVRNLLDFARPRTARIETIDVGAVVRGVTEFMDWELQRAGVALVWEGPSSALVNGDANLLHQVFINLLTNAVQALDQADGRSADSPRRIVVRILPDRLGSSSADASLTAIEIEDNGPGIATALLATIFEPFVTTRHHAAGTGLGLAVARTVVEEQAGRIEVENVESGDAVAGARFRVLLPSANRSQ
jgi:signal transduction histidine kinase